MREVLKDAYSAQQQREGELLKCNLPSLLIRFVTDQLGQGEHRLYWYSPRQARQFIQRSSR